MAMLSLAAARSHIEAAAVHLRHADGLVADAFRDHWQAGRQLLAAVDSMHDAADALEAALEIDFGVFFKDGRWHIASDHGEWLLHNAAG